MANENNTKQTQQFTVQSRIEVIDKASKNFGKLGEITKIGKARLTVKFDNGWMGRYMYKNHVKKTEMNNAVSERDDAVCNLAISAGALIGLCGYRRGYDKQI